MAANRLVQVLDMPYKAINLPLLVLQLLLELLTGRVELRQLRHRAFVLLICGRVGWVLGSERAAFGGRSGVVLQHLSEVFKVRLPGLAFDLDVADRPPALGCAIEFVCGE
jgi:hypothetical protein